MVRVAAAQPQPARGPVSAGVGAGRLAARDQAGQDKAADEPEQDRQTKAARIAQAPDLVAQGAAENAGATTSGPIDQAGRAGESRHALGDAPHMRREARETASRRLGDLLAGDRLDGRCGAAAHGRDPGGVTRLRGLGDGRFVRRTGATNQSATVGRSKTPSPRCVGPMIRSREARCSRATRLHGSSPDRFIVRFIGRPHGP